MQSFGMCNIRVEYVWISWDFRIPMGHVWILVALQIKRAHQFNILALSSHLVPLRMFARFVFTGGGITVTAQCQQDCLVNYSFKQFQHPHSTTLSLISNLSA